MVNNKKSIPLALQASRLHSMYPESQITWAGHNQIIWKHKIQPTPLSIVYEIKLEYVQNSFPKVYVVNPNPLPKAKGAKKLMHVYDEQKQRLCLYYPTAKEWDCSMMISDTVVPWISEWLFYYEIWVITGHWNGGGIHCQKNQIG